jgi:spore germination protein GerM
MTVKVFFHRSTLAGGQLTARTRTVPYTRAVATAAMTQLLAGPTAAERNAGYSSWFSSQTAGMLRVIRISGGTAHADFRDFRLIIPNASSSAGSKALLDELDATLKQFPTVHSTVYSFNGNVAAFYEWLQRVPPGTG